MTTPPAPPSTVGLAPLSAADVNQLIGQHLRDFLDVKNTIAQDQGWLAAIELESDPYYFSLDQETLIKSAISTLDTSLAAVDMTFITRLIGLY